ncbi:MAG: ATP-binding protein [Peptococcales bacterium]|jgi:two-component system sensor histidine kinase BaeS
MKLSSKLSLVLIVTVLTAGILISVFSLKATKSFFDQYIFKVREAQLDQWEDIYQEYYLYQGSWQGVENLRIMGGGGMMMHGHGRGMNSMMNRQNVVLADKDGIILTHPYPEQIGKTLDQNLLYKGRTIRVDNKIVGYLFPEELFVPGTRELEQKFITSVLFAVILGSLLASLIAILFGLWWSKKLTKPLEELVNASEKIAKGDFQYSLNFHTKDEFGSLAQAFNKMTRELNHSLEVRQQMFADISHELRTPLTILGSKLEASLEANETLDAPQLSSLYDEVIRLQGLVKELQDLSKLQTGQVKLNIKKIDPRQFTYDLGILVAAEAKARGIKFELDVSPELTYLKADLEKLKQILLNLLSNAFRHTQSGGLVTLRFRKIQGNAVIEVIDTGTGISPEELTNIFERFYRIDKSRTRATGGTGLGLAITQGYIKAHKGEIKVESDLGKGTRFIITLPLNEENECN